MEKLIYGVAVLLIAFVQKLPLLWAAWLGRRCGAAAYWLDARHRRMALQNLTRCFAADKTPREIRALARENFRRLGENYCSAIKTAAMTWAELGPHVEFDQTDRLPEPVVGGRAQNCIVAIGHFGNFELYARYGRVRPGYQYAATYRALKQPRLNRLLQKLRAHSGVQFFERRTEAGALKAALAKRSVLLGLLADQHAGKRGVGAPFFGQVCSTSPAPALLALRYNCPLHTSICYRVGLGRWRIQTGPAIPTHEGAKPRSLESISTDINQAFEAAVRQDPANWFWVHNRWKPFRSRRRLSPVEHAESLPLG